MHEVERYQHTLHARTTGFKRKVERAREIIERAMTVIPHPYIAFSGGADSEIVLDLLYTSGYRMDVLFGDDGCDFSQSLHFLKETEAHYTFHLTRIRSLDPWATWCQEMGRPELAEDPQALVAWGNPHEWDATWHSLTKDAPLHGYDGVFLGLLASESRSRAYALHDGWKPLYQVKSEGGMWHCSPLASWTKRDVWAYIVGQGLSYNPVYDRLADLGVPLERRRVAPLTCFRVLQYGSSVALRSGWPDLYNRLCATFPRVREYS